MSLRLHNTLTRRKEVFTPLDADRVRLYVCGPTVYDRAHIGNARPVIVFDVLFRLLRHLYGPEHVRYVRNITDIDDKIIVRAAELGIPIDELTESTTREFHEDVAALGCLPPTVEPRATEHIPEMIAVIERLIATGHAYPADGNVLFDVPSMPAYGKLSHRSQGEMIAGARVEVAPYKRSDTDFVLWKPAAANEPGWPSPWGRGRPGWHVECSAMSWKHLGETFDIHGGGIDLIFPHHENEIAQSCCAFDTAFMAQVWMHNGFLQVEGEKMSKSLGNFVTIRDLLATGIFGGRAWPGDVLRLAMLRTHYRQPIDWTVSALMESESVLFSWAKLGHEHFSQESDIRANLDDDELEHELRDDLNIPGVLARLHIMFREAKSYPQVRARFFEALRFLGFKNLLKPGFFVNGIDSLLFASGPQPTQEDFTSLLVMRGRLANNIVAGSEETISRFGRVGFTVTVDEYGTLKLENGTSAEFQALVQERIEDRLAARAAKNWGESDRIRDELAAMGIALKDNKDGTTSWELARTGAR